MFQVRNSAPERLAADVRLSDDRSQLVIVGHLQSDTFGEWVMFQSAFADLASVDVVDVLRRTQSSFFAGINLMLVDDDSEVLSLRYAVQMERLKPEHLAQDIILMANLADQLEKDLSFRDEF